MTTTILGSNGKLGRVLSHFSARAGLNWRRQARTEPADVVWNGEFSDPSLDDICRPGATLINMIGNTGSDAETLWRANVGMVEDLLAKAAETGVAHVILASSAAVYGAPTGDPFQEDDPLRPQSLYGYSKVAMENAARRFAQRPDSPAITILRIGNVTGADALTTAALRHIAAHKPMPLHCFGGGVAPLRSYIGSLDFFRTIRTFSDDRASGLRIINVAHPQPVRLDALLHGYRATFLPRLVYETMPAPQGTFDASTLATQQLQKHLPFDVFANSAQAFARQVPQATIQ